MKKNSTTPLFELRKRQTEFPKEKVNSSKKAYDFIRGFYQDDINVFESSYILLVNPHCETIGYAKISQGGISQVLVDIRIVCKYAVESLATGVIFAHNHPSGNLKPSEADHAITKKIKEALGILNINLLDSLIITDTEYFSFADEGYL